MHAPLTLPPSLFFARVFEVRHPFLLLLSVASVLVLYDRGCAAWREACRTVRGVRHTAWTLYALYAALHLANAINRALLYNNTATAAVLLLFGVLRKR